MKRWTAYADADLKLKFFGQEFLGLHDTSVAVMGEQTGDGPTAYAITAAGDLYLLGITLPAQLVLSDATRTFTIGPDQLHARQHHYVDGSISFTPRGTTNFPSRGACSIRSASRT